jgi:hypothetical protein
LDLHVLEAEMLKERDELSTVFRNALAVNSTGLKPSFSWALQSNALHAGIRDIAALQLACNGHWQSFSDFLVDVIRDSA